MSRRDGAGTGESGPDLVVLVGLGAVVSVLKRRDESDPEAEPQGHDEGEHFGLERDVERPQNGAMVLPVRDPYVHDDVPAEHEDTEGT